MNNWKDIIKRDWESKKLPPKTKQIDKIIEYLKVYPKRTLAMISKELNLYMKSKRLRNILETHPDIEVSGKYPTVYSYRGE